MWHKVGEYGFEALFSFFCEISHYYENFKFLMKNLAIIF
jgi:hypothetical protein